jgi:hypothetical protein
VRAAGCPVVPDPAALPTVAELRHSEEFLASLGARPTGSAAHDRYIAWIRQQLRTIPGLRVHDLDYRIHRWTSQSAALTLDVGGQHQRVPIADAIPYSKPTGSDGVAAPLVYLDDSQPISHANASGRIVVRPAPAGSVPNYDFLLPIVSWETYDPGHTIDPTQNFYGDFINYSPRVTDLRAAATAGAVGIIFVKDRPLRQIIGHYEPYEGEAWGVPGVFVGSDQGKQLRDAIASGKPATAEISDVASFDDATTPSIEAVLPGRSAQRIVVDSHTDGTNAVEDNGPIAMIAMARYFAALPMACRPRTIQFAFSTAHFYQRVANPADRDGGAEQLAQQLDREYDQGTVSSVVVLEHLGARDFEPVPRTDGGPGAELKDTGRRSVQFIGVTPSVNLVGAVDQVVRKYGMNRTIVLQGSDAPGATVPLHCSFGGEGTPFERHLLPTVGVIAAPQFLYDPAIQMDGLDVGVMHSELLGFTQLVAELGPMPQVAVSGAVDVERALRALGAPACPPDG